MNSFIENIEGRRAFLPPIDEAKLKYFAVVTMLIDHLTYAFLERAPGPDGRVLCFSVPNGLLIDNIGRAIGRQAFPIFCFFLVEGFLRTRSRIKYFVRLVIFALLSQFPFQKCLFPQSDELHANVICTLAIGMLAIWVIDEMWKLCIKSTEDSSGEKNALPGNRWENAEPAEIRLYSVSLVRMIIFLAAGFGSVAGFCKLAEVLQSDYGMGGVILIVLMYCLRKYRILLLFVSWAWMSWYNSFEIYAVPAFLLLACYNGKRGRQNKYFFYFFYPVHLLLIWLVRRHFFGI